MKSTRRKRSRAKNEELTAVLADLAGYTGELREAYFRHWQVHGKSWTPADEALIRGIFPDVADSVTPATLFEVMDGVVYVDGIPWQ